MYAMVPLGTQVETILHTHQQSEIIFCCFFLKKKKVISIFKVQLYNV